MQEQPAFFSNSLAPELSLVPEERAFRHAIAKLQRLEQVLAIRGEVKANGTAAR